MSVDTLPSASTLDAGGLNPAANSAAGPPHTDGPAGAPDVAPGGELASQAIDVTGLHAGGDISIFNNAVTIREAHRQTVVRRFSADDGRAATLEEEARAVEYFAGVDGEAAAIARHLEERRVLLLTAPAGARKVTASLGAAKRLQARGHCTGPPLVFEPLDRHVRVDLRRLPEQHASLHGRVAVFRYPLSRGNRDLARALTATEPAAWARLAESLRERDACVVLTLTPEEAQQLADGQAPRALHRELAPHPPPVLERWLDEALRERGDGAGETVRVLEEARVELVRRFHFGPHLRDFVAFFAGLGPGVPLEAALPLFQDPSRRLLHDEGDDFEGWLFGFTLALAQCTPDAGSVRWLDFDRLRRYLHRWLRRDLELTPGAANPDEDAEPGEVRLELSDDTLRTRSRIDVQRNPATLADEVRFCDGRPAGTLWDDLLQRHRRVLTALLPRLRDLAERAPRDERSLGEMAARILGRIGEMDCERIVLPLADRWAELGDGRHRVLVGALYEGVIASSDAPFRARCLRHLRSMQRDAETPRGAGRVEAAIGAYTWIGYHDFRLAADELFSISRAHLVPMIGDAAAVARTITGLQGELARPGTREPARRMHEMLRKLVDRIYAERGDIFLGVQFGLASLAAAHGVGSLLRELRVWIGKGGASMGVLVALLFLPEGGIADQLAEDGGAAAGAEEEDTARCGQFVRALGGGEEDVLQAVRFLGDLHDCVTSPWATEGRVRRHFHERLREHLADWARQALRVPELEEPARAFFEQLARTHGGSMRELVASAVSTGEFAREPALARFAGALRL